MHQPPLLDIDIGDVALDQLGALFEIGAQQNKLSRWRQLAGAPVTAIGVVTHEIPPLPVGRRSRGCCIAAARPWPRPCTRRVSAESCLRSTLAGTRPRAAR